MNLVVDIFFRLVSYLPKLVSWWLYTPKRTKENIEVFISAKEGSVELWCDKYQSKFNVVLEFKNNNPFPIEIDRVEISGHLHGASMKAVELFGAKLGNSKKVNFYISEKMDESNLDIVNKAPHDETLSLEVKAVIINKYHYIRDFRYHFDRLMCKFYNKKLPQVLEKTA